MDNIQLYILQFDKPIQEKLNHLRQVILEAAPNCTEKIAWGVPTYMYHGFLVQFAVNKYHIGFYSSKEAINHFQEQLQEYKKNKKNTIQFPLNQDIPYHLVKEITKYCYKKNETL